MIGKIMMRCFSINILFLAFCFSLQLNSQVLYTQGGVNFSQFKSSSSFDFYSSIVRAEAIIGVHYLNKQYFYVNHEMGYLGKGARLSNQRNKSRLNYWHFGSTLGAKYNYKSMGYIYGGGGMAFDYRVGDNIKLAEVYGNLSKQKHEWGMSAEVGIMLDLKSQFYLNVEYNKIWSINHFLEIPSGSALKNRSNLLMMGLGYQL